MRVRQLYILMGLSGLALCARGASAQPFVVDRFDRSLDTAGVTLVDFDGHLANPLIVLTLAPPSGAVFPVTAALSANNSRLYFRDTGTVGAGGPAKTVSLFDATPTEFAMSIFPDRDGDSESHVLSITFTDAVNNVTNVSIPIHVVDQDLNSAPPFAVQVDFSNDVSGFFGNPAHRSIVKQAAEDWTYFLADTSLDAVSANSEFTYVWAFPNAWTTPPPNGHS